MTKQHPVLVEEKWLYCGTICVGVIILQCREDHPFQSAPGGSLGTPAAAWDSLLCCAKAVVSAINVVKPNHAADPADSPSDGSRPESLLSTQAAAIRNNLQPDATAATMTTTNTTSASTEEQLQNRESAAAGGSSVLDLTGGANSNSTSAASSVLNGPSAASSLDHHHHHRLPSSVRCDCVSLHVPHINLQVLVEGWQGPAVRTEGTYNSALYVQTAEASSSSSSNEKNRSLSKAAAAAPRSRYNAGDAPNNCILNYCEVLPSQVVEDLLKSGEARIPLTALTSGRRLKKGSSWSLPVAAPPNQRHAQEEKSNNRSIMCRFEIFQSINKKDGPNDEGRLSFALACREESLPHNNNNNKCAEDKGNNAAAVGLDSSKGDGENDKHDEAIPLLLSTTRNRVLLTISLESTQNHLTAAADAADDGGALGNRRRDGSAASDKKERVSGEPHDHDDDDDGDGFSGPEGSLLPRLCSKATSERFVEGEWTCGVCGLRGQLRPGGGAEGRASCAFYDMTSLRRSCPHTFHAHCARCVRHSCVFSITPAIS